MDAVKLLGLGGAEAPDHLASDLLSVSLLPEGARADLWTLLEPNLAPVVDTSAAATVAAFCREHGVTEDQLVPVVRGCRLLFRRAAGLDLGVEDVARDLRALCGDDVETIRRLASLYARALPLVRTHNIVALMVEYGAVLDDANIRLDHVATTRHDLAKTVPIALMSLRFHDLDAKKHLAVQVPLPVLAKIKAMCDALLTPPAR